MSITKFIVSIIIPIILSHPAYKQNTYFFFDPVTNNACDETNYWTPFDKSTTCYRFVSVTMNDSESNDKIKIMLDHNIGISDFSKYKTVLKEKTSNWKRYKGTIDLIDQSLIFKIMKYKKEPAYKSPAKPPFKLGSYTSNSEYIIKGKHINERGYWTKTIHKIKFAYAIDINGNNVISPLQEKYGLRPVLDIEKSLLKTNSQNIDISNIVKKGKKIAKNYEEKKYDGHIYQQLQGFTVTKDKLIFMSSNNDNPSKSVMYSYKLYSIDTLYKKKYDSTGHGNGMTYNTKEDKVLLLGPGKVIMYNSNTLNKEKEFPNSKYPSFNAIGYNYNSNVYIGHGARKLFVTDTVKMEKLYEWGTTMFETSQDLEYYNGFAFFCSTDWGSNSDYQNYSFFKVGVNIINVYDVRLDQDKNPTKNFGRLICRLQISGLGEIESISFRGGYVYFGFAVHKKHEPSYVFYKVDYKQLAKEVKKIS